MIISIIPKEVTYFKLLTVAKGWTDPAETLTLAKLTPLLIFLNQKLNLKH